MTSIEEARDRHRQEVEWMRLWRENGGGQHGPHTETVTMPLDRFAGFMRASLDAAIQELDAALAKVAGAMGDVATERRRQIEAEGWTPEHDDAHRSGQMATAAACYAMPRDGLPVFAVSWFWPWDWSWWKPTNRRRDLIRAGALIVAEIDRLDRAVDRQKVDGGARG